MKLIALGSQRQCEDCRTQTYRKFLAPFWHLRGIPWQFSLMQLFILWSLPLCAHFAHLNFWPLEVYLSQLPSVLPPLHFLTAFGVIVCTFLCPYLHCQFERSLKAGNESLHPQGFFELKTPPNFSHTAKSKAKGQEQRKRNCRG